MILSEILTKPQQYAVISILIKIMEADGIINPNEIQFINQVLKDFEISEREMENIDFYDVPQSISVLIGLDECIKKVINEMFTRIAKCDGYADPRELEIINSLGI